MKQTQSTAAATAAYQRASTLDTTVFFRGSLMSFLAKGEDTGGRFALMEFQSRPGTEPPSHVHDWEHEMLYVLEGVLELYVENAVLVAHAGDGFRPSGQGARLSHPLSPPPGTGHGPGGGEHAVGLDRLVLEMSELAKTLDLPEEGAVYPPVDPARALRAASLADVHYLTPEEIACQMPRYPRPSGPSGPGLRETV